MKVNRWSKFFVFIIISFMIFNISTMFVEINAAGTITCSGYVRDESSNGISGATVRLYVLDYDVPKYTETTTSSSGYYSASRSFSQPNPVEIAVIVSKDGYETESWGDTVNPGSYTHNFVLIEEPTPDPELYWNSPTNNALITFSPTNNDFTFNYGAAYLDTIKLFIGPSGSVPVDQYGSTYSDMGSSVSKTVDLGSVAATNLHGMVRADLVGYISGSEELRATRNFNFSKQTSIIETTLENGMEDLGSELYLIIYDPPGDGSYSTFTESTEVTRTNSFSLEVGIGIEVALEASLFNIGTDAKFGVNFEYGYEYEWAHTEIDTLELTSSLNTEDRELVGPGFGDLYWGEREVLIWKINSTCTTYADGTEIYTDPTLFFGVDYSENVLVSHLNAPEAWKLQNPNVNPSLYEDPSIVTLEQTNLEYEGGTGAIDVTHEEISTTSTSHSFSLEVTYETSVKLGLGKTTISGSIGSQFKHNEEQASSVSTNYHIYDDDGGVDTYDYFHYDVGTDLRFGVPIFRNTPNENDLLRSRSSNPWEHNTIDFLPPEANQPIITYDTDSDGFFPSEDDTPLVEIYMEDEAEISVATIIYSDDNGMSWYVVNLQERIALPNNWYGYIPGHEHQTEIWWYVLATDDNGNTVIIKNPDDEYFEYSIISRPPDVELLSPNDGDTHKESILVEWTGSDPDDDPLTYKLAYQLSGGGWTLIVQGLTNNSYLWDISDIADSETVLLRVYVDDGYCPSESDTSDFVFSIDNDDIPEVSLLAPLSSFTYDGMLTIDWGIVDPDEFVTSYNLYYAVNSGEPVWITLEEEIAENVFTFDWDTTSIIYSQTVRLKIEAENTLDASVEATSGLFTLDNRPSIQMNLIQPNGGEIINENCTITWNVQYSDPLILYNITLEYSSNTEDWTTIVTDINGTSYLWNTTSVAAGLNYRLRITLTGTYLGVNLDAIVDISESTFIINHNIDTSIPTVNTALPFGITIISLTMISYVSLRIFRKRKVRDN